MKKFMSEFKEFIAKGDVMSMAVGIIIGGAYHSILRNYHRRYRFHWNQHNIWRCKHHDW